MSTHWTERSAEDFVFRIGADFIAQLEEKMETEKISQNDLAQKIGKTGGRVSQVFNHPGNITLGNIVRYTRALGMKASVLAYEDGDPENKKGPINAGVFKTCWQKCGKPHDYWDLEHITTGTTVIYAPRLQTKNVGNMIFAFGPVGTATIPYSVGNVLNQNLDLLPVVAKEQIKKEATSWNR